MAKLAALLLGAVVAGGALVGLPAAPASAAPPPPTITSPTSDNVPCTEMFDLLTVTGTAQPGATVTVYDLPNALTSATADDTGAWSAVFEVRKLSYSLTAVADDGTGESAPSPAVSFTIPDTPALTHLRVTPAYFSPRNHDGYLDRQKVSIITHAAGILRFTVRPYLSANVVRTRTITTKTIPGHTYTWYWYGLDDAGHYVPDGNYDPGVEFSSPSCPDITMTSFSHIDNTRPTFQSTGMLFRTFYPRHDDALGPFRDFATPRVVGLSEVVSGEGYLYRHGGTKVLRHVAVGTGYQGTVRWHWRGRHADGSLYPAGWYDIRFRLRDGSGNSVSTPRLTLRLSHEHVVAHHLVDQKPAAHSSWVTIDTPCPSSVSTTTTRYVDGLRIVYCSVENTDTLNVNYLFRMPRGVVYQIRPFVYGVANAGGFPLRFALWDFAAPGWHVVGDADRAEGRYDLDTSSGTRYLSPRHNVRLATLPDWFTDQTEDYDLRYVGVDVRYGTLAD